MAHSHFMSTQPDIISFQHQHPSHLTRVTSVSSHVSRKPHSTTVREVSARASSSAQTGNTKTQANPGGKVITHSNNCLQKACLGRTVHTHLNGCCRFKWRPKIWRLPRYIWTAHQRTAEHSSSWLELPSPEALLEKWSKRSEKSTQFPPSVPWRSGFHTTAPKSQSSAVHHRRTSHLNL